MIQVNIAVLFQLLRKRAAQILRESVAEGGFSFSVEYSPDYAVVDGQVGTERTVTASVMDVEETRVGKHGHVICLHAGAFNGERHGKERAAEMSGYDIQVPANHVGLDGSDFAESGCDDVMDEGAVNHLICYHNFLFRLR